MEPQTIRVHPADTILLPLDRDTAEALYHWLGETPNSDSPQWSWTWAPYVALADALGYHLPQWVRDKAS